MKLLKVRPRYELGEKVVVYRGNGGLTPWAHIRAIRVTFTKEGREVYYDLGGAVTWTNQDEGNLANHNELIAGLGAIRMMRKNETPKTGQFFQDLAILLEGLENNIETRLNDYEYPDNVDN